MHLEEDQYDEYFKTIVVGNSGVGKTKIIQTFDKGIKPSHTTPTVGVDYCSKKIQVQSNRKVKIQIWDTAGQQQYKSITMAHYKNAVGALVVYDVSNRSSFESAGDWINVIRDRADDTVIIGLIANKIDLPPGRRIISPEQGQNLANTFKVFYKQTTVEDINTLKGVFQRLATEIDRASKLNSMEFSKNSVHIQQPSKNNNDSCPC